MIAKRSKSRCENAVGKITQSFKFLLGGVVNTLIGCNVITKFCPYMIFLLIQIPGDFLKEKLLMYDYIITGAGLYGAVIAAALTAAKAVNL